MKLVTLKNEAAIRFAALKNAGMGGDRKHLKKKRQKKGVRHSENTYLLDAIGQFNSEQINTKLKKYKNYI